MRKMRIDVAGGIGTGKGTRSWSAVYKRETKSNGDPLQRAGCKQPRPRRWPLGAVATIALAGFVSLTTASRVCALAELGAVGEGVESVETPTASESVTKTVTRTAAKTAIKRKTLPRLSWRRSAAFGGRGAGGYAAVAADAGAGWLAVGGEAGLSIGRPLHDPRTRSLAIAGIRDLRFGSGGELYIATTRGFWILPSLATGSTSVLQESSPATGELARRVNRIATGPGFVALATDDGAFVANSRRAQHSEPGPKPRLQWTRVDAGFPSGPVAAVAAEVQQDTTYLWAIVGPALWRVRLSAAGAVSDVREVVPPGRPHGELPVDLVTDLPGGVVALVYADLILFRVREASVGRHVWEVARPVLPPGASIKRFGHWPGGFWLGTDRGLLISHSKAGPWRRAGAPAGRAAAHAAAALDPRLYVAGAAGLLYAEPVLADAIRAPAARRRRAPSIGAVHRVALRHQGLETRIFEDAWRGVRRRGWFPTVGLRLGVDRDKARAWEEDEVFVSGESHLLRDNDNDRSLDLAASLTLSWDLRDIAYEPEQIDLSREARLVIGLRDDVLDEVNQLYFERLAVESELAQLRSGPAAERDASAALPEEPRVAIQRAITLDLRLEELTAGLDAWTGGWFSEQLERFTSEKWNL